MKGTWVAAGLMLSVEACAVPAAPTAAAPAVTAPPAAPVAAGPPVGRCDAGTLPLLGREAFPGGGEALLAAAQKGTVAVDWTDGTARIVAGCHLPGTYKEIPGRDGRRGRLMAGQRVLLRTDEIIGACAAATHLVATFATDDRTGISNPAGLNAKTRLRAVLVPLPCPPLEDTGVAPGCIAKGTTAKQRLARVVARDAEAVRGQGAAFALDRWALIPNHRRGLLGLSDVPDRFLGQQKWWLYDQYDRTDEKRDTYELIDRAKATPPPAIRWNPPYKELDVAPAFTDCFADLVDPDLTIKVIF